MDKIVEKPGKENSPSDMASISGYLFDASILKYIEQVRGQVVVGKEFMIQDAMQLAIDAFVDSVRHYIGAYLVALGGIDVLVFTGGIGENGAMIRQAICRNLRFAGLQLDDQKNNVRSQEVKISAVESGAEIWIVPTNEEIVVARQTQMVLNTN